MFVALECEKPRHENNPKAHQQMNDKKDVVHLYNKIFLSCKKK